MILKKTLKSEKGFLLIESIVALAVLSILLVALYPLVVNWLNLLEIEKANVEMGRSLYEASVEWPKNPSNTNSIIESNDTLLRLADDNHRMEVKIIATEFKE